MKLLDKNLLKISDGSGTISLFGIAVPIFLQNLLGHMLAMVNTIILASYDQRYVTAISMAANSLTFFGLIFIVVSTGISVTLAVSLGKGDKEKSRNLVGAALVLSCITSIIMTVAAYLFYEPVLRFLNLEEALIPIAKQYLMIRILYLLFDCPARCIGSVLTTYGYAKYSVIAGVTANIVNLVFSYIAVYKFPFALFSDEITGLALSSTFGTIANIGIQMIFFFIHVPFNLFGNLRLTKPLVLLGFPGAVSNISYTISSLITTSIVGFLGSVLVNTKVYISNIVYYVYILGWAIGSANATMIGRTCGNGELDKANRMFYQNLRIVVFCNIIFSLIVALLRHPLLNMFTKDEVVHNFASLIFFLDIIVEAGRGMNHIGQNGLNGAGEVRYTTIISIASCWIFGVGAAYLFAIPLGLGLTGIWIAFAIDETTRGALYLIRWKKGKWRKNFESGSLLMQ